MKQIIGFLFFLVLGIGLFSTLVSRIEWEAVWDVLRGFSLPNAFLIFLLTGIFFFVGAMKWQQILKGQGSSLSLYVVWKTYLAGFSITFFAPMIVFAGEFFRAYSLEKTYEVPIAKGLASVIIDRILEITSYLIVIVLGTLVFFLWGTYFSLTTLAVITGTILGFSLFLGFFYFHMFRSNSIIRMFVRSKKISNIVEIEEEASKFFHLNNPHFWHALALAFVKSFVGLVRVWVLMMFLSKTQTIVFLPAITVLGIYYMALLIPIPAALGSHDAMQAFVFRSFGLGAPIGAAFAFVLRAVEVVFALLGLFYFTHLGIGLVKSIILSRIQKVFA